MAKQSNNSNLHLTLEERRIILTGITNGSTKTSIAKTLGKDNSTIGKEIKLHRILKFKCSLPLECSNYRRCKHDRKCNLSCPDYVKFTCKRRDRSPGACNGCSGYNKCHYDKFYYSPEEAEKSYKETLVESRQGVDMSRERAAEISKTIGPLLKQGQAPYQIIQSNPDLNICERTLYNYLESGLFKEFADFTLFDLRRFVSRKPSKKLAAKYKERKDHKYLIGRTHNEYLEYINCNPNARIVQMDTVYNSEETGPFMQTFKFIDLGVLIAFFHEKKNAEEMTNGVDLLESILGTELFKKHVEILLTDRGTEFAYADRIETSKDMTRRTRVYYCDPMASYQKGSIENNHELLRYICPKHTDLYALGLTSQEQLNKVISNINSVPFEKLGGKSSLELLEFTYPDFYEKLKSFGIRKIPNDQVILKPYLLKV